MRCLTHCFSKLKPLTNKRAGNQGVIAGTSVPTCKIQTRNTEQRFGNWDYRYVGSSRLLYICGPYKRTLSFVLGASSTYESLNLSNCGPRFESVSLHLITRQSQYNTYICIYIYVYTSNSRALTTKTPTHCTLNFSKQPRGPGGVPPHCVPRSWLSSKLQPPVWKMTLLPIRHTRVWNPY